MHPTELKQTDSATLVISWSDGQTRRYSVSELRDRCPCATCREKRNADPPPATVLPILSTEEARPLTLSGMRPVGNYAYNIACSDGHDTGIFPLEMLRELGEAVQ